MCRQEFSGKAEFMFHVRGHFETKVSDIAAADVLARSLVDNSGLCTWAPPTPISAFHADACGKGVFQDDTIMLKFWLVYNEEYKDVNHFVAIKFSICKHREFVVLSLTSKFLTMIFTIVNLWILANLCKISILLSVGHILVAID